jgi:hypothetical protein
MAVLVASGICEKKFYGKVSNSAPFNQNMMPNEKPGMNRRKQAIGDLISL